jgi:putative ubiquitin-RnfH superfamily antitoxin RatB of RatAB toxin-antitoxin module
MDSNEIKVEVAFALPDRQKIITLRVQVGTTVAQAIEQSRIAEHFPEINLAHHKVGIFGKLTKTDTVLRDFDRVEIYRMLVADPKEGRRKRAEGGRAVKKGGE